MGQRLDLQSGTCGIVTHLLHQLPVSVARHVDTMTYKKWHDLVALASYNSVCEACKTDKFNGPLA